VIDSNTQLEVCAAEQFEAFRSETGAVPFLFGHSLGGLLATSMVLNHNVNVAGLLLSAPAYTPFVSLANRIKLAVLKLLAPRFTQELPYYPHNLTHDEIEQEKGRNDPLNHQFKSASIITWIIDTGKRSIKQASELKVATLILIPGQDQVVDTQGITEFISAAPKQFITQQVYPDYRHEALNETPDRREQVHADIEQWLANQE